MSPTRLLLLLLGALALAACGSSDEVAQPIACDGLGRCPAGLICDPTLNVCLRGQTQRPDAGAPDGRADAAPPDARPAALSLAPATQDFGMVTVGSAGAPLTFEVHNDGELPSAAVAATIDGDASFSVAGGGCAGAPLAGGARCTLLVQFRPTGAPGPRAATLRVDGAGGATATAALSGTGLAPGAITLAPTSASFAAQPIGTRSAAELFTLRNTGGSPSGALTTALAGAAGRFAIASSDCPASLPAGGSCRIGVVFTPDAVGVAQGISLSVVEAGGGSVAATLAGTGVARITVENAGGGEVASAPAAITCGATCAASFSESPVTLTATPDAQHTFRGWSGACTGTGPCTVALVQAEHAVTASFDLVPAALAITPAQRDFGAVVLGATAPPRQFLIENRGGAASGALSARTSDAAYVVAGGTCAGASLAAGESCTVAVRFAPSGAAGPRPATLTVSGAGELAVTAELTGTALGPGTLTITPATHDFGAAPLGSDGEPFELTVENTGEGATGTPVVALTDDTHFAIVAHDCAALAPGQTCTVAVAFRPSAVGAAHAASLTVSATPGGNVAAALQGRATAAVAVTVEGGGTVSSAPAGIDCGSTCEASFAEAPVTLTATPDALHRFAGWSGACAGSDPCVLALDAPDSAVTARFEPRPAALAVDPTAQSFGAVVLGAASEPIPFTVENPGGAATGALSATLSDGDSYSVTGGTCPGATLGPGESCSVLVRFNPTGAAGARPATLTIGATPGGTTAAALSGTALTPGALALAPATRDFGAVAIGGSGAAQPFTVRNDGGAPTGALSASLSDATHFTITENGCAAPLPAGGTCTVSVAFAPASIGVKQGVSLTVAATPGGSVASTLRGTGTAELTVSHQGGGTVTSAPAGIDCGATCSASFSATPTLSATPLPTHTFAGWQGAGCAGTGTCEPALTASTQTVTARFTERPACEFVTVSTLAGDGRQLHIDSPDGLSASFHFPKWLVVDGAGVLWVSSGIAGVRIVQPSGATTTLEQFLGAAAMDRDAAGTLYATAFSEFRSDVFVRAPGGTITALAGGPTGYMDGTGTQARFQFAFTGPNAITAEGGLVRAADGALLVSDPGNHRLRRIAPDGTTSTIAGDGSTAVLSGPTGLVLDGAGNLYVADAHAHRIRRVTPGGTVTTVAGSGTAGTRDGAAGEAQFNGPFALARDAAGNLYVADTLNNRIRKVAPDGTTTTIAGGDEGFSAGTTTGCAARFNSPFGLALSGNKLYVADRDNARIRTIVLP